jgi:hypothetical protein
MPNDRNEPARKRPSNQEKASMSDLLWASEELMAKIAEAKATMTCRSIRRLGTQIGRRTSLTVIWTFLTTIGATAERDRSSAPLTDGALRIVARGTRQDGVAGEADRSGREAA